MEEEFNYQLNLDNKIDLSIRDRGKEIIVSSYLTGTFQRLNSKIFSYRVINHWECQGLIKGVKKDVNSWKEFSIIDIVWIHIIGELRKFGFPIEKIKAVKENLEKASESTHAIACSKFPAIEFSVGQAILGKMPVTLVIFENGTTKALSDEEYIKSFNELHQQSFISISINKLIQEAFPKLDLTPMLTKWFVFDEPELDLIEYSRLKEAHSIEVKKKGNKIGMIKVKEAINTNEVAMHDLINQHSHQELLVFIDNYKKSRVLRTIKNKYPKA